MLTISHILRKLYFETSLGNYFETSPLMLPQRRLSPCNPIPT